MDWLKAHLELVISLVIGSVGGFFGLKGTYLGLRLEHNALRREFDAHIRDKSAMTALTAEVRELGRRIDRLLEHKG